MSKVTKNGFSHFRRRFEAFHKMRVPTGLKKIGHIWPGQILSHSNQMLLTHPDAEFFIHSTFLSNQVFKSTWVDWNGQRKNSGIQRKPKN